MKKKTTAKKLAKKVRGPMKLNEAMKKAKSPAEKKKVLKNLRKMKKKK